MRGIIKKTRKIILSLFFITLLSLLLISIIPSNNIVNSNEDLKSDLKQELLDNIGNYDSNKIVLKNTNKELANEIANRLNAKLRITNDGSFATLTLRNGNTILDVVSNKDNEDILKYLSVDYEAKVSEVVNDYEEEIDEHSLQINKPNYSINDPYYNKQTYLDYLNLNNIWSYTKGSNITVAVIDTGIDYDHEEFKGKISEYSYNATEDKIVKDYIDSNGNYDWSLIDDEQGHGTAVTGVIAASMNNGIGITGIAPQVTIITIKAECNPDGTFKNTSDLVFGLYYAIERDVDVVNMSFGGTEGNQFEEATKLAVDSDIICVASAGNYSTAQLTYPAADPNVIGVGALKEDSFELAEYSNYGENVNVVAPGTVYTTLKNNKYGTKNGTSFSSPIVSSVIALQISKDKYNSTYREFSKKSELLYASCYDLGDLGYDFYYGYGAIDVNAFLLSERKTVTFNYLTEEIDNTTQVFIKNRPLQNIPEPERNYAVFDGWYYDIYCTEEYQLYEDSWSDDLTLYCNWANEDDGVPYTYVELDDGTIEIRSYTGKRRYITIPDYIDEKVVSSIGRGAFSNQTRLRVVNLPSNLKIIKDNAFENCTNITSIVIPDTVETIGKYAFSNNIRLYNVNFTNDSKLNIIGDFSFSSCSKLNRFDIPINVSQINGSVFFGSTNLMQINAHKNSNYLSSIDGVLYNKSTTTLLVYPSGLKDETYDLPSSVNKLGEYSFSFSKIKTIDLKNVTKIEDYAFNYSKIETIDIKDNVTSLGKGTFAYSNIKNITLGHGIKELPEECFSCTHNLEEITISNNIQKILDFCFVYSSLETINFEANSQLTCIGNQSFCTTNIKELYLPNSLVSIKEASFYLTPLKVLHIDSNSQLISIGEKAFASTFIENINLSNELQTIGDFAFENTLLKEITIPSSVTNYASSAFASCHDLENIFVDDNNLNYLDINGVVYTRDLKTIHEYPSGRKDANYKINNSVTKVGKYAFYGAHILTKVNIPNGVTIIDEYAFYDCINISSYILPSSLEEIQEGAFSNNKKLSSITIPDNVTLISQYAFSGNMNMSNVYWGSNPKINRLSYASFSNCGIYSFEIPSNVSSVSQHVFSGCNKLNNITFKSNSKLESISAYMFNGCNNLQTIMFESGSKLRSIQAHAFDGMDKLREVDFGDAKIQNIDNYSFRYCKSLKLINIPEGVEEIGRFAFYGCSSLSVITIPESVDFIGRLAFYNTNNINIYFKSSILPLGLQEHWDEGIGGYYVGVKEVYTNGDFELARLTNDTIAIIKYNGSEEILDLTKLNLGEITQIGGSSFRGSSIKEIILPNTLKTIERYAFAYSNIERITIPDSVVQINEYAFISTPLNSITISNNSDLEKIGKYAFAYCDNLTSINIPSKVTQIGIYAFLESGLQSVNFSDDINLTEINEGVFQKTKLNKVKIPNSVTLINHSAFRDINTLKEVEFNNNKLQLMSNVFYNTGLEKVYIPSTLEYIGEYSLVGLENLKEFIVDSSNSYYASIDGVLYSKDLKKLIAYPGGKTGEFTIPNHVEVIGFGAFENSKVTKVKFEEGINLLTLGYRAFYNSKELKEITIPQSVVSIDYYAFAMCKNLKTVNFDINSKLTGIYEGAFYGCINLENIIVPDEIYEISDYAFSGCLKLDHLPISENSKLLGIYDYAFSNTGIKELHLPDSLLYIGNYSFQGIDITNLVIPDANKEQLIIELGAFSECNSLEEITIPFIGASLDDNELGWFGYIFGAGSYEANATYVPQSLKKVIISEGQTVLPEYAFYGLNTIEEIDMPCTIKYLGSNCMKDCNAKYELVNEIMPIKNIYSYYEGLALLEDMIGKGITGEVKIGEGVTSLGYYAFEGCTSLTNIIIPSTVTSIGNGAFSGCTSLTNIIIPSTVTSIGSGAFSGCISITDMTIPEGVTRINNALFKDCTSLVTVNLPSNATYMSSKVFNECTSLTEVTIPEGVTNIENSTFYNCLSLKDITIPSSVTSIENYAFRYCKSLTNVSLSEGLVTIGYQSFEFCESLEKIEIPSSVKTIESSAFGSCSNLSEVILNEGLETIGSKSFSMCMKLQKLSIPSTVIKIMDSAFYYNTAMTDVEFAKDSRIEVIENSAFKSCSSLATFEVPSSIIRIGENAFSGCDMLYEVTNNSDLTLTIGSNDNGCIAKNAKILIDKQGNKTYNDENVGFEIIIYNDFRFIKENDEYVLIGYIGDEETITLPDNIYGHSYTIDEFRGGKNIIIPETFTEINNRAFYSNNSIVSVVLPQTIDTIGEHAFHACHSLERINLPASLKTIKNYAFMSCQTLKEIIIPSEVKSIGYYAFSGCQALKNITIPNNVTYIGNDALSSCPSLEEVVFLENSPIKQIPYEMFARCTSLEKVVLPKSLREIRSNAFYKCTALKEINLPETLEILGDQCFYECTALNKMELPKSVYSIGASSFYGCDFESFKIDEKNENLSYYDGIIYNYDKTDIIYIFDVESITLPDTIVEIRDGLFKGCVKLENIIIPNSVTKIGNSAFQGCTSLKGIIIPENVNTIGEYAFQGCTSLIQVTFLNKNTNLKIESFAFDGCSSISELVLPDGVSEINQFSFADCESLVNLTFSKSVKFVDSYALSSCESLENLYFKGTLEDWLAIDFRYNVRYSKNLYLLNQNNNYELVTNIEIPSTVNAIKNYQFCGFSCIEKVIIPSNVKSIGESAFLNCENLKEVEINTSISTISHGLFSNCPSLEKIQLPSSVETIDSYAFFNCRSLESIDIPNSVTFIGYGAFQQCESLKSVVLPQSLEKTEGSVFSGCKSLINVDLSKNCKLSEIESGMFSFCNSLQTITIPQNILKIGTGAFSLCNNLRVIKNDSDLTLSFRSTDNGEVAYYARVIIDKNGNKTYRDENSGYDIIEINNFKFIKENNQYKLVAYLGDEETITLPSDIYGYSYSLYRFNGAKNVIIPEGFTQIDYEAFAYNSTLESIVIPNTVTIIKIAAFDACYSLKSISMSNALEHIESNAFSRCESLKIVNLPDSLQSIDSYAFSKCTSLESIVIPENVKTISEKSFYDCNALERITLSGNIETIKKLAFYNTAYYNDENNWIDGALFIDNYLIKVDPQAKFFNPVINIKTFAEDAFEECYSLEIVKISGDNDDILNDCQNIKTLIINELPSSYIYKYFSTSENRVPITLKNIVLMDDCDITQSKVFKSGIFTSITNMNIFVDKNELDVQWDKNYPGWHNGNKVYYKGEWVEITFDNNNSKRKEYYSINQIIRQPIIRDYKTVSHLYSFIGWDIDGDGNPDSFPATSNVNIEAKAIYSSKLRKYLVTYYDMDQITILYQKEYEYGSLIKLESASDKDEYLFDGWYNYPNDLIVTGNIDIYSNWKEKCIHNYISDITEPTCLDKGFTTFTCDKCGESYTDNIVNALGHTEVIDQKIEPTCTTSGLTEGKHCLVCNEIIVVQNIINATGHELSYFDKKDATCSENGYESYEKCNRCDYTTCKIINKLGHNYSSVITNPTCTTQGYITYTCSRCNDTYIDNYITSLGHTEVIDIKVEPTCTTTGLTEGKHCSVCNEVIVVQYIINATGHELSYFDKKDATCLEDGYEAYEKCSRCDYTTYQVINKLGHNYNLTITNPTCTTQGYTTHTCSRCNDTYIDNYITSLGHNYTSKFEWNNEDVTLILTCSNDSLHKVELKPLVTSEVVKQPTTTEEGLKRLKATISYDNKEYSEVKEIIIPKLQYEIGDIDSNKEINTDDVIYLLMNSYFPEEYPINQGCDYTLDNEVNTDDVVYLLMHIYFPDEYPLNNSKKLSSEDETNNLNVLLSRSSNNIVYYNEPNNKQVYNMLDNKYILNKDKRNNIKKYI